MYHQAVWLRRITALLLFAWPMSQATAQDDCATAQVLTSWATLTIPGGTYNSGATFENPSCFFGGDSHSRWFVFTCISPGVLNFSIIPNQSADFDFALWDITSTYPALPCNVAAGTELSCNYAATTGTTGVGCGSFGCMPSVNLQACHSYAILANRWTSSSTTGFTLDFTGTTAGIGPAGGSGSVSFTNTPVCVGQTTTFTPSVISNNYTYSWTFGDGTSSTDQSPQHAYGAPGNYSVTLTINAINPTGCNDSATYTANVFVSTPPGISVTPATSNTCPGQSATLTAQSGASGATYSWSPSLGLNTTTGNTVTASPLGTTTYTATVTNANGCTASATAVINVNSTFTISASATQATVCPGGSSDLTASGANTYTWSPSTGLNTTTGATVTASPATSSSYTVTGTDASGCMDTAVLTVTVATPPTVSVTPTNPIICLGQSETLIASGASSYAWSPGTGLNQTSGANVDAAPAANTTYTVTGTDGNGCTGTATVAIQVIANAAISISPASPVLCNGGNSDLTASGASSYTWTPSTGLSATTGATVNASPTVTTTYTVVGTVSAGCTAEATVVVTISPSPTVSVTPTNPSICTGNSSTLTASGATTYSWTPSTSLSATTGASVTATPSSTITYSITGTSAAGCTGSTTVTVTVNTPVQVSIAASDSTLCPGETATLTGSNVTQYQWQPGNGTGYTLDVTPAVTTTYSVTGTDANNCTTQASLIISVATVAPISAVNNSGLVCVGDSASLTASGASTYTWLPNSALSSTSGSSVNASPATNTTYTVTSVDANGCSATALIAVDVDPIPVAQFSMTPLSGCDPLTVQFSSSSTNAIAVQWYFGDGGTSSLDSTSHEYTVGSYLPWLVVTNTAGCGDTAFASDSVAVYAPPVAMFTVSPDTGVLTAYTEATFTFTNLSQGASTYYWNFDDGNTSTDFEPVHNYMTEGAYTVLLTATSAEGCSDSYSIGPLLVDGIPPLFIPNTFTPNSDGVNDVFNIYGIAIQSMRLIIFDRWGNQLFTTEDLAQGWDGTFKGKTMNPGVYVYKAELILQDGKELLKFGDINLIR